MESKLRKKFIYFSVGIIAIVLLSIMAFVNVTNFYNLKRSSDELLKTLVENNGVMPSFKLNDNSKEEKTVYLKNFSNRFFTVKTDNKKNVITVNTDDVFFTSASEAVEYAKDVLSSGKSRGYYGGFKYVVENTENGKLIAFVDVVKDFDVFYSNLGNSVVISFFVLGFVTFFSFVLSKKAVAPMVQAYEKQNAFITDASHELKTPLAIINTSADVLEMERGESKWTGNIHKQVNRLNGLIGNLISLTKLEESDDLDRLEFSLSDTLDDCVMDVKDYALSLDKNIVTDIEKDISFKGDEKLIRQVIGILLDNAIKYAREKSDINVKLTKQNKKIVFTVENEADNLEIKNYNILFERFYRADSSRNSKTGGYGIGLSIAQSIVLKHKGKISADSFDGERIVFTVKL
ncbi:sensor histidine kinase [Parvimonas micra]|uniref:sensor histidine kinase n=1 Tax=Parvimonas micra TaxID=33033 RepID=UPI00200502F6|nr:HAMP domain-containing sensor histidine kinase [Parvimonas micra]MCK6131053.1 HAMP domain-containing histidine kinase [Parvimonas micra]MCK6136701.1 HAMP domain-containing histidine kinase [Parvimonas micra]MCK6138172.1 HAMP domain-containing histidine kinase [Parvimonas micra]MCK6154706.1 HAMP domain-containing histidine kinase [Parvimonas micra]